MQIFARYRNFSVSARAWLRCRNIISAATREIFCEAVLEAFQTDEHEPKYHGATAHALKSFSHLPYPEISRVHGTIFGGSSRNHVK